MPAIAKPKESLDANAYRRRHEQASQRLAREQVSDIQRTRMLTAMAEVAAEHGAANVTVAHVVERAGVSRRTFYELFDDRDDCFIAAFDEALGRVARRLVDAYEIQQEWIEQIRACVIAGLAFLEEEPFMGRLLIVEALAGGPEILAKRQRALLPMIATVDEGRMQASRRTGPPPLTAEGVVGGVLAVLHARLLEDSQRPLLDLAGMLIGMIVLPYLGAASAHRECSRPTPAARVDGPVARDRVSLAALRMRLTYRTIRVLTAVAANPGLSNRAVADTAGVGDQGQMSKLLARLRVLGLVENAKAPASGRGESNAWVLTDLGWQVQSALAQETQS